MGGWVCGWMGVGAGGGRVVSDFSAEGVGIAPTNQSPVRRKVPRAPRFEAAVT